MTCKQLSGAEATGATLEQVGTGNTVSRLCMKLPTNMKQTTQITLRESAWQDEACSILA